MSNEKIMILKMLEEGKINAQEAATLIDSLGKEESANKDYKKENQNKHCHNSRQQNYQQHQQYNNNQQQHQQYQQNRQNFEDFAEDISKKFDNLARGFEPKVKKFTDTIVEKTASIVDEISKSFSSKDSVVYDDFSFNNDLTKVFELTVENMNSELILEGKNGSVSVSGYNGDKITVRVKYRPKNGPANIDFIKSGDKYHLSYDRDYFKYVALEAFVPENMFEYIKAKSSNSSITVEKLISKYIDVKTSNSSITARELSAEEIKLKTSNSSIKMEQVKGRNCEAKTSNSKIFVTNVDVESLKLSTSNASINLNIDYFNLYDNYTWVAETSNSKININVPTNRDLGYHFKALTSLGKIKLGLTGMNYITNTPNYIEAKSIDFDNAKKCIKFSAETSNGSVVIE